MLLLVFLSDWKPVLSNATNTRLTCRPALSVPALPLDLLLRLTRP